MEVEGTCLSKNFDETVRLQSEIRREWIREVRGERLQEIAGRKTGGRYNIVVILQYSNKKYLLQPFSKIVVERTCLKRELGICSHFEVRYKMYIYDHTIRTMKFAEKPCFKRQICSIPVTTDAAKSAFRFISVLRDRQENCFERSGTAIRNCKIISGVREKLRVVVCSTEGGVKKSLGKATPE